MESQIEDGLKQYKEFPDQKSVTLLISEDRRPKARRVVRRLEVQIRRLCALPGLG